MTVVFNFKSYKSFLKERFQNQRGGLTAAATAINCQPSLLSKIISSKRQITKDQAFGLADFFNLNQFERDYFFQLVEFDRASTKTYRDHLHEQIDKLRINHEQRQKTGEKSLRTQTEDQSAYYLSGTMLYIHLLTSTKKYKTSETIARRLQLPERYVKTVLEQLKTVGLISEKNHEYHYEKGQVHLEKNDPMYWAMAYNSRQKAYQSIIQNQNKPLHFTMVTAISQSDFELFRERCLEMIAEFNKISKPSASEDLVSFNLDFFT